MSDDGAGDSVFPSDDVPGLTKGEFIVALFAAAYINRGYDSRLAVMHAEDAADIYFEKMGESHW